MTITKWKRGSNVPKKPARWYRINKTTDKREVSPKARRYLSYKIKVYYEEKKLAEKGLIKAYEERKIKGDKIRLWIKFSTHQGDEPLYIEYFIEGYDKDYEKLKEILFQKVDETFNYQRGHEELIDTLETGTERNRIQEFSVREGFCHIAYKHRKNEKWQIQK